MNEARNQLFSQKGLPPTQAALVEHTAIVAYVAVNAVDDVVGSTLSGH